MYNPLKTGHFYLYKYGVPGHPVIMCMTENINNLF